MSILKFRGVVNRIYDHFNIFKAYPMLRGERSQLGWRKVCNALFTMPSRAGSFNKRELLGWERKHSTSYSIPDIEKRAIRLFHTSMPYTRKYRLLDIPRITSDEVFEEDLRTMRRYRSDKGVSFRLDSILGDDFSSVHEYVVTSLHCGKHKMYSFEQACNALPKSTSSCYPLYEKKSSLKAIGDAKTKIAKMVTCDDAVSVLKLLNTQICTVFHRFTTRLYHGEQRVEKKVKIRQVFGVPFPVTIVESMLFGSALHEICSRKINSFFSYSVTRNDISRQVQDVRSAAKITDRVIICGDVSQIDASITPFSLYLVVEFLASHYRYNATWLRILLAYFVWLVFTPIMWSAKTLSWSIGGNISGSLLTSFINSFTLLLAIDYFYLTTYGQHVTPAEVKILGDDFILIVDKERDLQKVISIFRLFNLKLHPEKSSVVNPTDAITYLGFNWNYEGEPEVSDLWYIARICFPERFVRVEGYERIIQRAASILFQIKGGGTIFEKVIVRQVSYFRKLLEKGVDPLIQYFDKSGSAFYIKIPYSVLKILGWRAF